MSLSTPIDPLSQVFDGHAGSRAADACRIKLFNSIEKSCNALSARTAPGRGSDGAWSRHVRGCMRGNTFPGGRLGRTTHVYCRSARPANPLMHTSRPSRAVRRVDHSCV